MPVSPCWSGFRSSMASCRCIWRSRRGSGNVHEMLCGYLPAVITGFLFTSIPNRTGQLPI